ncbi:hypothetical protein WAK64_20435 [Bacillus spongiae]|uniref:Uncharacterized protein n=1 Tax=Bacillus spongiae TaxID=2683610 RepID=A0ABU8HJ17_9BACI
MKVNEVISDFLYIHTKSAENYALSCGISFQEFATVFSEELQHLLLLQHPVDFPSFHFPTRFDYVQKEDLASLVTDIKENSDFSWVDFGDLAGLDELTGEEIGQLLYFAHMKKPLYSPLFNRLNNHFAYLSYNEGLTTQTYYRDFNQFYSMLSTVIVNKLVMHKKEKKLFSKKTMKVAPIPTEILKHLEEKLNEGVAFSLVKSVISRGKVQVPFWIMGDYQDLNEMKEDFGEKSRRNASGMLMYDRREKEWQLYFS